MIVLSREDLMSVLGEGIHVGFRKGTDHPQSHEYWMMIAGMPDELWGEVLGYVVDGLVAMKIVEVKPDERA